MSGTHRHRATRARRRPRKQRGEDKKALKIFTAISSVTILGAAIALSQTDAYDRLGDLQAGAESDRPKDTAGADATSAKNQAARILPGEELPPASRSKREGEGKKSPGRRAVARVAQHGNGETTTVPGEDGFRPSDTQGHRRIEYRVELEDGLPFSGAQVAKKVHTTLTDRRSWQDMKDVAFERTDDDNVDLRIVLATPDTVDRLCRPLDTGGEVSCRVEDRVVLNAKRWAVGVPYYKDVDTYRTYLVDHEVGHFLGEDHVGCEGAGEPAPVMMQQTKGIGACRPNPWPTVR